MKIFILTLIANFFITFFAIAQTMSERIEGTKLVKLSHVLTFLGKDSIDLALNEDFEMVEDNCGQIIRHAHLKMSQRQFYGHFTDVSRLDPSLVLTEGNYTDDGLKEGPFVSRYLNGKLQAKGNFKNNMYDGHWELFYDDEKPKLTFDASNGDISINDVWDEKGNKTVSNGKGSYRVDIGAMYWKGQLLNGKPEGTWHAYGTDDASKISIVNESYKSGTFKKGKGPLGEYTDAPRITLVPVNILPFTRAEQLYISTVPCGGVKQKHIVNAQYRNGFNAFSDEIKRAVLPYLSKVDLTPYDDTLVIEGVVTKTGNIVRLGTNNTFNVSIARALVQQLNMLPPLEPATVDGKPAAQKINITFTFDRGVYRFWYRFLPLDLTTIK